MTTDEAKAVLANYYIDGDPDLVRALAAMIAEVERLTARAEAAEAALDAMRMEPTDEEAIDALIEFRRHTNFGVGLKAALTAFLAARGKL